MERTSAEKILEIAQELVQTRGLNAMSYADISEQLGITKAGIHYHFPSKDNLILEMVKRYHQNFRYGTAHVNTISKTGLERLEKHMAYHAGLVQIRALCLCAMLASDSESLSEDVRFEVQAFFNTSRAWLSDALEFGRRDGTLTFRGSPDLEAAQVLALYEGAMLLARAWNDVERYNEPVQRYLATVSTI